MTPQKETTSFHPLLYSVMLWKTDEKKSRSLPNSTENGRKKDQAPAVRGMGRGSLLISAWMNFNSS